MRVTHASKLGPLTLLSGALVLSIVFFILISIRLNPGEAPLPRPAEILKAAILSNALRIVLVHNHPSGTLEPSPEDQEFTQAVRQACELMGIDLYDHLIVTDKGFCSFRERGLL